MSLKCSVSITLNSTPQLGPAPYGWWTLHWTTLLWQTRRGLDICFSDFWKQIRWMDFYFIYLFFNFFCLLYNIVLVCHTSTCIHHGCTRVSLPEPPSHLPPHSIPLGHPSAPALRILYPALNLDWWFVSYMILSCFNAILPNHPTLSLSHRVQKTVLYICLFCCLTYRVVVTIFLNSIYMR